MDDLSMLPEETRKALELQLKHCDGRDCRCGAYGSCECACDDVDWTPAEVYRLRAKLKCAESERDALRETVKRLNRRVQVAEAGIAEKVKVSAPGSFGRGLANAAAEMYKAERDALRKRIDDAPVGHPVSVDFSEMTLTVTIPNGFRTNGWPFALVPLDDAEAKG